MRIRGLILLRVAGALLCLGSLHAEIIDRIAAVVNGRIVTASDIRKERILASAFGEMAKDDAALLQDLIDRALVEEQVTQFPGIETEDTQVDTALRDIKAPAGIPPGELREAVQRRILRARFFELRFRQFIRATDEEIQKYYDEVFVPAARSRGLTSIPTLEQAKESIRPNVVDEKMSTDVQSWLETIRRRSDVEIFN